MQERKKPNNSENESTKVVDFSNDIIYVKKEKKKETIAKYALLIALITLVVAVLPVQSWVSGIILSVQKKEYSINIIDGEEFRFPQLVMNENRFIHIEQKISPKVKNDKIIFSYKIENFGQNYLDEYYTKIFVVDPINRVRGELSLPKDQKNKFSAIFNLPPGNEKLFGEWNLYSYVYSRNETYSVVKMPFIVEQKEPLYFSILPAVVMAFLMAIFMYFRILKVFF